MIFLSVESYARSCSKMATREEKLLDNATEMMLLRINEMKVSLTNLLMRIEHDHQNISFPDVLDAFAVISGQVSSVC